jgi:hypothetical protein
MKEIWGIWGEDKSGKTTLALTFPKPMAYMEMDIKGSDLAKVRFAKDFANGNIITEYNGKKLGYPIPMQTLTVRPQVRRVIGMKELWDEFLTDYVNLLVDGNISTITIDTGTLLWEIVTTGYLQEKQETQFDSKGNLLPNEKLRSSLQKEEYREPNLRMRGLLYQAAVHDKNLVITHHARDEYRPMLNSMTGKIEGQPTGKRERAGFTSLGDSAFGIIHTYIVRKAQNNGNLVPQCTIDLCRMLELQDMKFTYPTYDMINKVKESILNSLGQDSK